MLANDDKKIGNMAQVYCDLARQAEASIRQIDERQGPYAAEIVEGCAPQWHVLICQPAHELIAAGHLAGRRFGVYVPELDKKVVRRGRSRVLRERMFPGYVLAFLWDLERHLRRVRACPGVSSILLKGDKPAIVPWSFIQDMQREELKSYVRANFTFGRGKRGRRDGDVAGSIRATMSCKSYFAGIEELAPDERIRLLHRALGLT